MDLEKQPERRSLLANAIEQAQRDDAIGRVTDGAPVVVTDDELLAMALERIGRMSPDAKVQLLRHLVASSPEVEQALREEIARRGE